MTKALLLRRTFSPWLVWWSAHLRRAPNPLAQGDSGSIVVYNAGFESQRLSEIAAWLPEFAGRIKRMQCSQRRRLESYDGSAHYNRVLQNRTEPNVYPDQDWKRTETS